MLYAEAVKTGAKTSEEIKNFFRGVKNYEGVAGRSPLIPTAKPPHLIGSWRSREVNLKSSTNLRNSPKPDM